MAFKVYGKTKIRGSINSDRYYSGDSKEAAASRESGKRVIGSLTDSNTGESVVFLFEDGTIGIDEKYSQNEAAAKIWTSLSEYLPYLDELQNKVALTYCLAAMKAFNMAETPEEKKEARALWDKAIKKAEQCFVT